MQFSTTWSLVFLAILYSSCVTVSAHPRYTQNEVQAFKRVCGPNSLYLLIRLNGHDVTHAAVKSAVNRNINSDIKGNAKGVDLHALQHAAIELGMDCQAFKMSRDLQSSDLPAIAHLETRNDEMGHYVLVTSCGDHGYDVIDGTSGQLTVYSSGRFQRFWSNHVLIPSASTHRQRRFVTLVPYLFLVAFSIAIAIRYRQRKAQIPSPLGAP